PRRARGCGPHRQRLGRSPLRDLGGGRRGFRGSRSLIVPLERTAPERAAEQGVRAASRLGLPCRRLGGDWGRQAVEVEEPVAPRALRLLRSLPHVEEILQAPSSYPKAASEAGETRPVRVGDVEVGGNELVLMAGPCAAESEELVEQAARAA